MLPFVLRARGPDRPPPASHSPIRQIQLEPDTYTRSLAPTDAQLLQLSMCSPLLSDLLNSNWKIYQKYMTEVKLKQTIVNCCHCSESSHLETENVRASLMSLVCNCLHPVCARCSVVSDVFKRTSALRHRISDNARYRYSFGFYCDGCGASNKVTPEHQLQDTTSSARNKNHQLKPWLVDFRRRPCRWCEKRCDDDCLLYRIKPWSPAQNGFKSPKTSRRDFDADIEEIRTRVASGQPTSPLALFSLTPDDVDSDDSASCSSHSSQDSLTAEEMETLEYGS